MRQSKPTFVRIAPVSPQGLKDFKSSAADGAHESVVNEYGPLVMALAHRAYWLNDDLCERIQEVWLLVFELLSSIDHDPALGELRDYVALQLWQDLVDRGRKRWPTPPTPLDQAMERLIPGREEDPAVSRERKRARDLLLAALDAFRAEGHEQDSELIFQHYFEGRNLAHIARARDEKPEWAHTRHHRARERFAVFLKKHPWRILFSDWDF